MTGLAEEANFTITGTLSERCLENFAHIFPAYLVLEVQCNFLGLM